MTPADILAKAEAAARRQALELTMYQQLRALALTTGLVREHRFHDTRKWRFDFAWPEKLIALEVDGGTWSNGRHNRGAGYAEDCVKGAEALLIGWRVLRATGEQVKDGTAAFWLERLIRGPL